MNIHEQIEWEKECQRRGTEAYYAAQDKLREKGQGDTTEVMSHLVRTRLREAGELLKDSVHNTEVGKGAKYNHIIREVAQDDYTKLAFIAIKCVLQALQRDSKNTLLKVSLDIGLKVESDLKCTLFELSNPEYYDAVNKSFRDQKITNFEHMHKVMMKKFNDFDVGWEDWTGVERTHVGSRILSGVLPVFDDVMYVAQQRTNKKIVYKLFTTVEFDDWAAEFEKERGLMSPQYLPLKIPPVPWEAQQMGGYYTAGMRLRFVKTKTKDHSEFVNRHFPKAHLRAVNKLQKTAWRINKRVLNVQNTMYTNGLGVGLPSKQQVEIPEFPPHLAKIPKLMLSEAQHEEISGWKDAAKRAHGLEKERRSKVIVFSGVNKLAKELAEWDEFYYVYTCDFRGRVYCATAGLTPQGADTARGLLEFRQGVRLGKGGAYWLAVHGANTYGIDKVPFAERIKWIKNNEEFIQRVSEDPISNREFWGNADKPYQFLAFCFEWVQADCGRNHEYLSTLSVGLDGSCNGLQHFSAMLRDQVGASATNLTKTGDNDPPNDIYGEVARVTTSKLRGLDDPRAHRWLNVGINRKCAKRPVMTLPYGAKPVSARAAILEYAGDNWAKFDLDEKYKWEYGKFLTPYLWESIGEVVVAARLAMDWLQMNAPNDFIKWLTPLQFPVYQFYRDSPFQNVRTKLLGGVRLNLRDFNLAGEPLMSRQRSGIVPNFIHSMDSTHMVMTILSTKLPAYSMVHDDFGTHAGNVQQMYRVARETFHTLYTKCDPLEHWAKQVGITTNSVPPKGDYNLDEILESKFFFS